MRPIRSHPHYHPHKLFDAICRMRGLRTDTELAEFFEVGAPLISKVRRGYLPLSGGLLLRIHEVTAIDIGWLKEMIGDRRSKQRTSDNKAVRRANRSVEASTYATASAVNPGDAAPPDSN